MKNLPYWLYESLPYFYAAMGVVAIANLEAIIGKISGMLLISAGAVIWQLRFTYRRRRRRPVPKDLSWGHNQRINPPKNLENVKRPAPKSEPQNPDPDGL